MYVSFQLLSSSYLTVPQNAFQSTYVSKFLRGVAPDHPPPPPPPRLTIIGELHTSMTHGLLCS